MIKFNLGEIMEKRNLTIQDVYEKTGVSRNTISQMINKEPKGIQFDTLDKIVSNLNVSVDQLIKYIPNNKVPFYIEDVSSDHRTMAHMQNVDGDSYADTLEKFFNLKLVLNSSQGESSMIFPVKAVANVEVSEEAKEYITKVDIYINTNNMFYIFLEKFHSNLLEDIEEEIANLINSSLTENIDTNIFDIENIEVNFIHSDEV